MIRFLPWGLLGPILLAMPLMSRAETAAGKGSAKEAAPAAQAATVREGFKLGQQVPANQLGRKLPPTPVANAPKPAPKEQRETSSSSPAPQETGASPHPRGKDNNGWFSRLRWPRFAWWQQVRSGILGHQQDDPDREPTKEDEARTYLTLGGSLLGIILLGAVISNIDPALLIVVSILAAAAMAYGIILFIQTSR